MFRLRTVVATAAVILIPLLCQGKEQNWVEVRSPNFIVVSNGGDKQARKAALQFEEIRAVFRHSLTVANAHPSPVITVLAVKDENSMRDLLPEYWVKGHSHPAGLFVGRLNQFCAAVQLDAPGMNPYETFYHEFYHTITVPYFPDLPVWLSEGLAEFYGHTEIEEKFVGMGQADANLLQELRTTSLIPLSVLFQVDQSSPYYNEANKTSIFYAESWALTHYLMIGDRAAHHAMLTSYLDALNQGKSQEEAANTGFGDLKKLQSDLYSYIGKAAFLYMKIPMTTAVTEDQLKLRPLSEAEVDAYRGEFAVLRGRSDDANTILQAGLRLDPNVALIQQYLAMSEFLAGQREKSLDSVSKAITLDPRNYFTRYLRAYLATSGIRMMTRDPQIEADLRQAISLNSDFAPSYGLLAVYLAAGNQNLDEALALAKKAVSIEPADSNQQLALAQVFAHMNRFDEANLAASRSSAWAKDPAAKANAQSFIAYLEQARQFQSRISADGSGNSPALKVREETSPSKPLSNSDGTNSPFVAPIQMELNISALGGYSVDLTPYIKNVLEAVRQKLGFSLKGGLDSQRTVSVEFAILSDGKIANMKVAGSSGDPETDQVAQNEISASNPLPAPPRELKGHPVRIRLQLSYIPEPSGGH
ncbi:MAG TPA: TonB family protein [Terriglobales bacterium]|jgi:TonB family protein|nr:TonB family protein [Terriglobales bacterium]